MRKKTVNALKIILFASIGILLVYLSIRVLSVEDRTAIMNSFRNANLWWVVICILCGFTSHFVRASRWRRLIRPMGYQPKMDTMTYAVFIGYLANYALPRLGDVSRCGILTTYEKIPISKSLGTMLVERTLDLFVFILLFLFTIALEFNELNAYLNETIYPRLSDKFAFIENPDHFLLFMLLGIISFVVMVFFIFKKRIIRTKLFKKLKELVQGIWQGFKSLLSIKKPLIFILETIIIWVMYYLMAYVCFFCFPETSNLGLNVGLSVLTIGSIAIMITAGGTGLYPIIIGQILVIYGVEYTTGFALGWVIWTGQTLLVLLFGSLSFLMISFKKRKKALETA